MERRRDESALTEGCRPKGPADEEHQPSLALIGPSGHALGQLFAGAGLALHTKGRHGGTGGNAGPDGLALPGQSRVNLGLGGIVRQPLFRQLHNLQLAEAGKPLGVLRRGVYVEALFQLAYAQNGYLLHRTLLPTMWAALSVSRGATDRAGSSPAAESAVSTAKRAMAGVLFSRLRWESTISDAPAWASVTAKRGGVLIGKMSLGTQNSLLEIVGIRAAAQGFDVMIGLQEHQVHAGQNLLGFVRDIAGVGQQSHGAVGGIDPIAAAARSVMAVGMAVTVHPPSTVG